MLEKESLNIRELIKIKLKRFRNVKENDALILELLDLKEKTLQKLKAYLKENCIMKVCVSNELFYDDFLVFLYEQNIKIVDGKWLFKNVAKETLDYIVYMKKSKIENEEITNIISTLFLIATALYNTWKNRNLTTASQTAQTITDAIKNGTVLAEDIMFIVDKMKENETVIEDEEE